MSNQPLANKKIAVLIEAQFIPHEIRTYQERFAAYGATVELVSRLWGNPTCASTRRSNRASSTRWNGWRRRWISSRSSPSDYAAVIMVANYASVRLRWNESAAMSTSPAEAARSAPAATFFRSAMRNPDVVKGAPCHGLWLLTPSPDVLAGRRVTCNPVVLADVVNAGATFVPAPATGAWDRHLVADDDLVTSTSAHNAEVCALFVDAVKDAILARPAAAKGRAEAAARSRSAPADEVRPTKRRILIVLSEWGYWGEELVGPLGEFDRAGYEVEFCTPNGRRPNAIPVSMDPDFFDPPLNRPVTTPEMAARVRRDRRSDNRPGQAAREPDQPRRLVPGAALLRRHCFRAQAGGL